jgi:DNA repair protein RadC
MKLKIDIQKIRIQHALDIYEIMQMVLKREDKVHHGKEHFWVLALDNANRIINLELISMGNTIRTTVSPMDVLSVPLQKKAAGLILVHNHPSGNPEPSQRDDDLTDLLIQACRLVNTPVLDHVIITEHSYCSYKESARLKRLEGSLKHVLAYDLEKLYYQEMQIAIKKVKKESKKQIAESLEKGLKQGKEQGLQEGEQIGLTQGRQEGKEEGEQIGILKVAKQMLKDGEPLGKIQQWTGLSLDLIEKIKAGHFIE